MGHTVLPNFLSYLDLISANPLKGYQHSSGIACCIGQRVSTPAFSYDCNTHGPCGFGQIS